MEAFSLEGKVAVVTGALGLLGQEHCRALLAAGAAVMATDLDSGRLDVLEDALARDAVDRVAGHVADITREGDVDALVRATIARFGRVDVLVNNAAIDDKVSALASPDESRFEHYSLERFQQSLAVNVTGTFLCSQRFGRLMGEQRSGSIINVASTYGLVAPQQDLYRRPDGSQPFWKGPAYPTSKAAVLGFTRYLAAYLGPRQVRVNALCPGGVYAGQEPHFCENYASRTPLGRMAERHDYRGAVVFLASDASAYMTGGTLVVDGGWTAC
jgi:NAD(P)-dependent dehydrogenase (short-subunit alcohol dehydrogenase family)